jgi:hypothetical protein
VDPLGEQKFKMTMDLLKALSHFQVANDRENDSALYRTHVPWVGPLAYLNILFKGAPEEVLLVVARSLKMPMALVEFLRRHNGVILFSGALSVYGVHGPGQLLYREDPFFDLPFNIELENRNWPPHDRKRFLAFGGYGFDGSRVCIDRVDSRIYLFQRGKETLLPTASYSWQNLHEWLSSEIARLSVLFDTRGKRLVDESLTVPSPLISS